MSALRFNKRLFAPFSGCRYVSGEYTTTPQYPPILDLSFDKVKQRKKEVEYEELKAVKTVEEKQIKLNMPRFYGFKCYLLQEDYIPYDSLALAQYLTRTHLLTGENLPECYGQTETGDIAKNVKGQVEDAIMFELEGYRRIQNQNLPKGEIEDVISLALTKQINRILLNNLARSFPHLRDVQVDFNSRVESFWLAGGLDPPEHIKRCRRGTWQKDRADEPTNRAMHYLGSANLALRTDKPLRPIVSFSDAENPAFTVPQFKLDPRTVGTMTEHRHLSNTPGFWPGDPREFGLLSYHKRGHMLERGYNDPLDDKEALDRQGILASFGWLNAQANFLGFNTFNDLTYPLVTQTVITNGQLWSFYVYQLNTLLNHSHYVKENPKRNICWAIQQLKLYEHLDGGKLVGFNEDVLELLLKFYVNAPEMRLGVNLKPYLGQDHKVCADYEDDDKRQWLEKEYKFLVSNRPRYKLPPEIYAWQKIYKIDNNTRFMDKKREPFEYGINPYKRTLDDRQPYYIPRALRPHLPRWKGRNAKEYFP